MWHIAKSKASQSHTQYNLYVTDNREIVCSQNIIYQYLLLPSHWTQNFPSTLSLHPFVPFLLNSSHATRITVQSNWSFLLFFFKSSLFFFAKCNRHTNYRSLPAKASTTKLASQDKLLPEHVQILNNDEKWTAITPQG